MAGKREYFYKEGGKVHRYEYCTMCQSGPYRQDDEDYEFVRKGSRTTPMNYCKSCCFTRQMFLDQFKTREKPLSPVKPVDLASKKKEPIELPPEPVVEEVDVTAVVTKPVEKVEVEVKVTRDEVKVKPHIDPEPQIESESKSEPKSIPETVPEESVTCEEKSKSESESEKSVTCEGEKQGEGKMTCQNDTDGQNDMEAEVQVNEVKPRNGRALGKIQRYKKARGLSDMRMKGAAQKFNFIVVRCADGTLYSSVTADPGLAVRNMNSVKGSAYTKPRSRRPVELIYSEAAKDKQRARESKKSFDGLDFIHKESYIQSKVNSSNQLELTSTQ